MQAEDFKIFDYETKRTIYSECQQTSCPNLEINFLCEFLKRGHNVVFVTINQPVSKIKNFFGNYSNSKNLYFVDCSPCSDTEESDKECSLKHIAHQIDSVWSMVDDKKVLFFDCGEILFSKFDQKDAFNFIHKLIRESEKDGIIIFCFLKQTLDPINQKKIQHLFDEVIFL